MENSINDNIRYKNIGSRIIVAGTDIHCIPEQYENLRNNYTRIVNMNNEFMFYINEFLSLSNELPRIKINNIEYMCLKAMPKREDKEKRTYRNIVVNKLNIDKDQTNNSIKKVYQNIDNKYYYSYEKQNDKYICSFDELMWKTLAYYKENINKNIDEPVLAVGLKVFNYSERFHDVFFNIISKVDEDGKIYFENCRLWLKDNIYLFREDAMKYYKKIDCELENDLLKNNNWVLRIREFLVSNKKFYKKEKDVLIDILARVDQDNIKYKWERRGNCE